MEKLCNSCLKKGRLHAMGKPTFIDEKEFVALAEKIRESENTGQDTV